MDIAQGIINFVTVNHPFFAFMATLIGYVAAKVKGARKDRTIRKQGAALEGVASAVEEFQERLNRREPQAVEDPKGLKQAIAYKVSEGREELDAAIGRMEEAKYQASPEPTLLDAAVSVAKAILP